jgi:hypothetical protein
MPCSDCHRRATRLAQPHEKRIAGDQHARFAQRRVRPTLIMLREPPSSSALRDSALATSWALIGIERAGGQLRDLPSPFDRGRPRLLLCRRCDVKTDHLSEPVRLREPKSVPVTRRRTTWCQRCLSCSWIGGGSRRVIGNRSMSRVTLWSRGRPPTTGRRRSTDCTRELLERRFRGGVGSRQSRS